MNATTTPRAELLALIQMTEEAIEFCKADGEDYSRQAEVLDKYRGQLAALGDSDGGVIRVDATEERGLLTRPEGGKAHRNQYGPCQVAYATDKQQAFALSLFDRKDVTKLTQGVTALDVVEVRAALVARKINKKAISTLIDRLLGCPDKPAAQGATVYVRQASDKQLAFLLSLAAERTPGVNADAIKAWAAAQGAKAVSDKITELLAMPKATVEARTIEAGVYVNTDGSTFRVYLGQKSGKMLAAQVVDGDFEYAGQADRFVKADARKMTLEEAGAWGKATGTCVVCARRLDDPTSVDRGIGPVCFSKF